ncbi:hypothetical protein ACQP25_37985 [Microtetraspora malaysiensis]|uniref:hypothetical protein n=1 Tax=Microtetraspora malaysiensis TaxID=161358 RepID=UPI003D925185
MEVLAHPVGAIERANCQDGNLVISIYEREGDVQAQIEFQRDVAKDINSNVSMLTGRNWSINVDDQTALQSARSALGGTVVFEPAAEKAGALTPVPGGVGPVTTALLLSHTVQAPSALRRA